jgi:hypothetical protein
MGSLDAPQRALHVDAVDPLDLFLRHFGQRIHLTDACVVDHDVEPAQRLLGMIDRGEHLVTSGDVGHHRGGLAAQRADFAGDGLDLLGLHVHQTDVGAVTRQTQRDATADALPRAGDQCNLSFYAHELLLQRPCRIAVTYSRGARSAGLIRPAPSPPAPFR